MQLLIHAPWEVNDAMKDLIEKKVEKLINFQENIIKAEVFLKNGEGVSINDKKVEIRLKTNASEVFAQDTTDELEKSVANVVEKLRRQLIRQKQKSSPHK
ncbi:MAG: ribosome-associated translation inhibitor RaiA [Saprospiraceae bacterium]